MGSSSNIVIVFEILPKVEPLLAVLVKNKHFANLITREALGKFYLHLKFNVYVIQIDLDFL